MSRAQLIDYIRKNDEQYQMRDLSRHTTEQLKAIKEAIEVKKQLEKEAKANK